MTFRFDTGKDKHTLEDHKPDARYNNVVEFDPAQQRQDTEDPYYAYLDSRDVQQNFFQTEVYPELWEDSSIHQDEENPWQVDPQPGLTDGKNNGAYHSRRPSHLWKFVASVVAAIGIGLLFGYVALSFFHGGGLPGGLADESVNSAKAGAQNGNAAQEPAGTGTSGLPIADSGSGSKVLISVQVAGQSYYLLQYGVFSTPEGAVQAQEELLTAGLAAGLDQTESNRVYAGISPDREQAKLLSNGLKAQGIELYVREVTLPAAAELNYNGTAESVDHYFDVSGRLLGELSSLSASLLSRTSTVQTADVSNLHLEWSEAIKALESGLPMAALEISANLKKSMAQGISALNEYNKNKSDGLLWEVQGSMMDYLAGQKKLLAALQ